MSQNGVTNSAASGNGCDRSIGSDHTILSGVAGGGGGRVVPSLAAGTGGGVMIGGAHRRGGGQQIGRLGEAGAWDSLGGKANDRESRLDPPARARGSEGIVLASEIASYTVGTAWTRESRPMPLGLTRDPNDNQITTTRALARAPSLPLLLS